MTGPRSAVSGRRGRSRHGAGRRGTGRRGAAGGAVWRAAGPVCAGPRGRAGAASACGGRLDAGAARCGEGCAAEVRSVRTRRHGATSTRPLPLHGLSSAGLSTLQCMVHHDADLSAVGLSTERPTGWQINTSSPLHRRPGAVEAVRAADRNGVGQAGTRSPWAGRRVPIGAGERRHGSQAVRTDCTTTARPVTIDMCPG